MGNAVAMTRRMIEDVRFVLGDDDEDETLRIDMIEGETDALEIISWAMRKRAEARAEEEALKRLIETYAARKQAAAKRAEKLTSVAAGIAEAIGVSPIRRPEGTIFKSARAAKVIVTDAALVPESFVRREIKVDLRAVASALKEGAEVPGATMSNGGESWSIRQ